MVHGRRNSVLSYAIETLGVRHVIVMGHYGCGGVAASMLPVSLPLAHPAHIAVQTWIQPIREIYQSSTRCVHCWCIAILIVTCILTRPEIVAHRNKSKYIPLTELPDLHDRTFLTRLWNRELSNFFLKSCITRTRWRECQSKCEPNCRILCYAWRALPPSFLYAFTALCLPIHSQHYASLPPPTSPSSSEPPSGSGKNGLQGTYVFIHGWVYDLENGEVTDLNVSLGPPGREIPKSPWPATEERERQKRIEREAKEKARPWIPVLDCRNFYPCYKHVLCITYFAR